MYAIVPVRVKINSNSASEINHAHELVKNIVTNWQETCEEDFKENGPELGSTASTAKEQPSYIFVRDPNDPINVVTE